MLFNEPQEKDFHSVGEVSQKTYTGKITIKPILTFRERSLVDSYRRNFMGNPSDDGSVNELVQNLAVMLSQIKYRVVQKEEWMNDLENLVDENVIMDLFTLVMSVEKAYREGLQKAADAAKKEMTQKT